MANPTLDLNPFIAAGGTQTVIDEMTATLNNRKAAAAAGEQSLTCELAAEPHVPDGWRLGPKDQIASRATGTIETSALIAQITLFLAEGQKGGGRIAGTELKKLLEGKLVLRASVLDWLLAHPEHIPDSWKGKYLFFWGDIYRRSGGSLCVRCLYWDGDRWRWGYFWLDDGWRSGNPAAVLASQP